MTVPFSNEEKDHAKLFLSNCRNIPVGFRNPLIGLKIFATLLPNNWLAETPLDACGEEAWRKGSVPSIKK
ncbi:hypothetical protein Q8G35_14425 [Peribacillus simplex]|uniref:Uncharacterized protein n=2 Tax=Peribacillus TaxID=2675229 RepID=A0AA90T1S5_9BACI|nr:MULTISPECIES: hypothetical protein [Peribacillus]MDP1419598.1 hypothetical protein [Peribacillus simplex]MDP1452564.1 hypothetical protein [Peribacillus frigoritolerans]